jgi:hypothetical protein
MVVKSHQMANSSPFRAFGAVVVNHTAGVDELICTGANNVSVTGGILFNYSL